MAFLNAAYTQAKGDTTDAGMKVPVKVSVKALLEAAQGAPPSGAVLYRVNEMYGGERFICEHRRKA